MWSEALLPVLRTYKVFGVISFSGKQGSNSGQACWTISRRAPYIIPIDNIGILCAEFGVPMRFNHKNGTRNAEFVANPDDFDIYRPAIGNMAYVVRGPHRKKVVKIAEVVRDKKTQAITGFKVKLAPHKGRAPSVIVNVDHVTKLEEHLKNEQGLEAMAVVTTEAGDGPPPALVPFVRIYPDY